MIGHEGESTVMLFVVKSHQTTHHIHPPAHLLRHWILAAFIGLASRLFLLPQPCLHLFLMDFVVEFQQPFEDLFTRFGMDGVTHPVVLGQVIDFVEMFISIQKYTSNTFQKLTGF
jgi:hypothetical protein